MLVVELDEPPELGVAVRGGAGAMMTGRMPDGVEVGPPGAGAAWGGAGAACVGAGVRGVAAGGWPVAGAGALVAAAPGAGEPVAARVPGGAGVGNVPGGTTAPATIQPVTPAESRTWRQTRPSSSRCGPST